MSRDYPDWIPTEKAAQARRVFHGRVDADRLKRLEGLIVAGQGSEIAFEVSFFLDDQGQILAQVALEGEVALQCQRTLGTFRQKLSSRSKVAIVADEAQEDRLPEDYESRLCPDQRLELLDLVGEEALLALPLVPVDPASDPLPDADPVADTHRPFAALGKLGKNLK
jgi:uncharacterized protein